MMKKDDAIMPYCRYFFNIKNHSLISKSNIITIEFLKLAYIKYDEVIVVKSSEGN